MNPDHKVPKTYQVKAATLLTDEQLDQLRNGVVLSDGPTRPAEVRRLRDSGRRSSLIWLLSPNSPQIRSPMPV